MNEFNFFSKDNLITRLSITIFNFFLFLNISLKANAEGVIPNPFNSTPIINANLATGLETGHQYIAIRDHFNNNGPENFVKALVSALPKGSEKRHLVFAWELHPMQMFDASIRRHIRECFRVAAKYDIPFLLHVNHEWLLPYMEINGDDYARTDMVEWVDWDKTPLIDWWSNWSVSFTGQPTRFPPRLTFNQPGLMNLLKSKADVILSEISNQVNIYGNKYFIGIDTGWETGLIEDHKGQLPVYHALSLEGYSKDKPPANRDNALIEIAKKFVDYEVSLYSNYLSSNQLFSHILVTSGGVAPSQPITAALNASITPGFSVTINNVNMQQIKNVIGLRPWVITESWNEREVSLKSLDGVGILPGQVPPSMLILYTWNLDIYNNTSLLSQITETLNRNPPTQPAGEVLGYLDSISKNNNGVTILQGWACAEQSEVALDLHIYANGPYPTGKHFLTARTNREAEIGLHNICKSFNPKSLFRFEVELPEDLAQLYAGKTIFIYGIHPSGEGGKNRLLGNSGNLVLPPVANPIPTPTPPPTQPPGEVLGYLDSISKNNNGVTILQGWACTEQSEVALDLHIYANGPYPTGKHFLTAKTNREAEPGLHNICKSFNPKSLFRFEVELPEVVAQLYAGKTIFIYGIHPSGEGSKNRLLGNSGNLVLPPVANPIPAPTPLPDPNNAGNVIGFIDSITRVNNKLFTSGWVCAQNYDQPLEIHLWAGNHPTGKHFLTAKSSELAEPNVRKRCKVNSDKTPLRFIVEIPEQDIKDLIGKPFVVYGIHPSGDPTKNRPLNNSGRWVIP